MAPLGSVLAAAPLWSPPVAPGPDVCGLCLQPVPIGSHARVCVCGRRLHVACVGHRVNWSGWRCGACLAAAGAAGAPGLAAGVLALDRAAALMSLADAEGTFATYAAARRRFVDVVQRVAARGGVPLPEDVILPPAPGVAVPVLFVQSFLGDAAFSYSTGTIEGTLCALKHWHEIKGRGTLASPTDDFNVRRTMDGIRRAHGGTVWGTPQPAKAIRPAMLHLLIEVADDMGDAALRRGDFRRAYGHARDAAWYLLTFLACLRREEAAAVRLAHLSPGVVPGTFHIFIPQSKNDQAWTGFTLPIAGSTESGLSLIDRLARLSRILGAWGKDAGGVLFGNMSNPAVPLASSQSILDRLMEVYVPEMAARGLDVPNEFRFSGHSFRRGGVTAIRDAARRHGVSTDDLRSLLMKFGRWKDPRCVEWYLSEDFYALAALTQRL